MTQNSLRLCTALDFCALVRARASLAQANSCTKISSSAQTCTVLSHTNFNDACPPVRFLTVSTSTDHYNPRNDYHFYYQVFSDDSFRNLAGQIEEYSVASRNFCQEVYLFPGRVHSRSSLLVDSVVCKMQSLLMRK